MTRHIDLTGHIYGGMEVIRRLDRPKRIWRWLCRCTTCGTESVRYGHMLRYDAKHGSTAHISCNACRYHDADERKQYPQLTREWDFYTRDYDVPWQTFAEFRQAVGDPPHSTSRLVIVDDDQHITANNLVWCECRQGRGACRIKPQTYRGVTKSISGWAAVWGVTRARACQLMDAYGSLDKIHGRRHDLKQKADAYLADRADITTPQE